MASDTNAERDKLIGALVSIDVSYDDESAHDRVFGRVVGIEHTSAGLTLLAEHDGESEADYLRRRDARVAAEALATRERWWICTDILARGGKKVLGPFESRDLALRVRTHYEDMHEPLTFWVDQEVVTDGE